MQEVDTGDFVVEDEEAEMARICSCLAGASGGVMLESEVKVRALLQLPVLDSCLVSRQVTSP